MPEISFLLPVYNGARFLAETLDSLLVQDHPDFDIVIVDDGSTDATPEIIERFRDPRIRTIRRENGGLVEALNHGLGMLDCAFVARIDADDLCAPDRLTRQRDFIDFTGASAVSSRSLHIDEVGNVLGVAGSYGIFNARADWLPAIEPYLPHPFLLARLDVLREIGGYRHAHLAEDADLCWRLADAVPIAVQGEVLGRYRLHTNSVSARSLRAGRVQAYYSQIAALNTRRRRAGVPELPYAPDLADAMERGDDWHQLFATYADQLDPDEKRHIRAASLLKLLDLASWRRYAPLAEDISAAADALRQIREIDPQNRAEAERLIESSMAKIPDRQERRGLGTLLGTLLNRR